MRVLVVGAGATGGAFGTRLQEAGREVTYLVRPRRAEALRRDGIRFVAPDGDRTHRVRAESMITSDRPYDLVVIAVKAPGLDQALVTAAEGIGPDTVVLPFLNGMDHLDVLRQRWPGQVLGGLVKIVATVDDTGAVVQMTPLCGMTVGTLDGSPLPPQVAGILDVPGVDLTVAADIVGQLWEKWVFIAAAGVVTCLLRNDVGSILAAGGEAHIRQAVAETEAVARAAGHPVGGASHAQSLELLTEPGSSFTSSLYRDLLHGRAQEAEHILGALAARADALGVETPMLDLTLTQIRAQHLSTAAAGAQ
ncbi:ketopantoate reductase family protein [Streptomyces sp. enrichment culture]|uniref:ketopantoate reductase family protein n=1 Tax=Streptomyces sp. enrichment culture TaxID=1795815 RepID=UPI003F5434B9